MTAPIPVLVARGTFASVAGVHDFSGTSFRFDEVDLADADALRSSGAQGLVVGLQTVGAAELEALAPGLRAISRAGIGLDTIDLAAAGRHGVAVIYQPSYATREVASHALSLLLAVIRRLTVGQAIVGDGWRGRRGLRGIRSLDETTLGVVGSGRIGNQLIEYAAPLFGRILVHDPYAKSVDPRATRADRLDDLLGESHAISLHLPLDDGTRSIIGARELALLPKGAVLVNVSRGGLVDEDALAAAIASGHLAGAGLDVFSEEPLPTESPLRGLANVVLTPHIAFLSDSAVERLERQTVEDLCGVLATGSLTHGRFAETA